MARPKWSGLLDLSNRALKQRFMSWIGKLTGEYEVTVEPRRSTRTNRQLSWWWPCVVHPFYEFLSEQDADITCPEDAHDILRGKFLRTPALVDPETGEVLEWRHKRTKELTPAEFSEFAEKARGWLMDQFGIVTLDPNEEPEPAEASARK